MSQAGVAVKKASTMSMQRPMGTKGIRETTDHNMLSPDRFTGLNP